MVEMSGWPISLLNKAKQEQREEALFPQPHAKRQRSDSPPDLDRGEGGIHASPEELKVDWKEKQELPITLSKDIYSRRHRGKISQLLKSGEWDFRCHCANPTPDFGSQLVQCSICKKLLHGRCIAVILGLPLTEVLGKRILICTFCRGEAADRQALEEELSSGKRVQFQETPEIINPPNPQPILGHLRLEAETENVKGDEINASATNPPAPPDNLNAISLSNARLL